jgi:hypothetical protein
MLEIPDTKKRDINKKEVARLLADPETFATVIHAVCLVYYGEEIYDLPSNEIYIRLHEDFGTMPCESIENKIQAILMATDTDEFYEDTQSFRHIALTLLGGDPEFESFSQLSLVEVFWAVYEVELNHGEAELSDSIRSMIKREIDGEADEDFDDELKPNYVIKAMVEYKKALRAQLKAVGFTDFNLPQVSPA